jgi:hypothetical protein
MELYISLTRGTTLQWNSACGQVSSSAVPALIQENSYF